MKICNEIADYIDLVQGGSLPVCREQKQLVQLVAKTFETEDVYCDEALLANYMRLERYLPFELFAWEKFCFALHCCTFRADGLPRWPDLFILVGRGSGKNGYLAFEDFCLLSHYNDIQQYNIDICANSEDQARTTFDDIYDILEANKKRLSRFFYWNKEKIVNLKTKSVLRFRTSNARTKDGGRQGKVDFDEVHEYENYKIIDVFTTGLGKKRHPRRTYITTDGYVRDGVLDDCKATAQSVLNGDFSDGGTLYFICKLDDEKEVDQEINWAKANPSLFLFEDKSLLEEIRREYAEFRQGKSVGGGFMTKRMNLPRSDVELAVTDWANLERASREVPELGGRTAVIGIDYAKTTDFVSAGVLLKEQGTYYWLDHTWVCRQSKDLHRIKAPLDEWAEQGLLTFVNDVEIDPELIAGWITAQSASYNIAKIALDDFRYSLMSNALKRIGFDAFESKNVKRVSRIDIMKIHPVITSAFLNGNIAWGKNTMMRWYTNNTKSVPVVPKGAKEADYGNMTYGKIEAKSRKTDGFFALAAAMTLQSELEHEQGDLAALPVLVF